MKITYHEATWKKVEVTLNTTDAKEEQVIEAVKKATCDSSVKNGNNIYPLLQIPDYNVIVVSDEEDKYAFMDTTGNDSILNFLFDEIYIKVSEGEETYWMTFRGKEYEVLKYLKQSNVKQNTLETVTNAINTTNANQ